jgi:hypothetical protein
MESGAQLTRISDGLRKIEHNSGEMLTIMKMMRDRTDIQKIQLLLEEAVNLLKKQHGGDLTYTLPVSKEYDLSPPYKITCSSDVSGCGDSHNCQCKSIPSPDKAVDIDISKLSYSECMILSEKIHKRVIEIDESESGTCPIKKLEIC